MSRKAFVTGVGMIPFTKPGANEPYFVMGADAARAALADAGVDYSQIQQAYVGYVYGDSTCGQKTLYQIRMTGIPVFNVNNNARPARPHCFWRVRQSKAARQTASLRLASSKWNAAQSTRSFQTARRLSRISII